MVHVMRSDEQIQISLQRQVVEEFFLHHVKYRVEDKFLR